MILRKALRLTITVIFCFVSFFAVAAHADNLADEAELQFKLGAESYQKGDFTGALEHFLASNRLVPNRNVVFNIARTYEELHAAPDAYRYYVDALVGETRDDQKRRIEDALKRVAPQVAVLKVTTDPPGAAVYLDRRDLGARGNTPANLGLSAGRHKVIVRARRLRIRRARQRRSRSRPRTKYFVQPRRDFGNGARRRRRRRDGENRRRRQRGARDNSL